MSQYIYLQLQNNRKQLFTCYSHGKFMYFNYVIFGFNNKSLSNVGLIFLFTFIFYNYIIYYVSFVTVTRTISVNIVHNLPATRKRVNSSLSYRAFGTPSTQPAGRKQENITRRVLKPLSRLTWLPACYQSFDSGATYCL